MSGHHGTHSEATMTTRKQKPTFPSMIELPTEQLQLTTVTVENKAPGRVERIARATDVPAAWTLPRRGKVTLH
jgi:hypothetical protein